jgi:hypothetical protein
MKIGKSTMTVLSALVFAGAMAMPAIAGQQFKNTDEFMARNPAIAAQLQENPKLIDDQAYVRSHPSLHRYLKNHPEARRDFKSHPERFLHKESKYQSHHN